MDSSVRNVKSWKEGTNVKWDVRVRHWIVLDCVGTVCRRMAGCYDHGNGLSSFINNGVYSLSNGVSASAIYNFKKAYDSVGNWVLYTILIEFNIHMKQVKRIKLK